MLTVQQLCRLTYCPMDITPNLIDKLARMRIMINMYPCGAQILLFSTAICTNKFIGARNKTCVQDHNTNGRQPSSTLASSM